MPYDAALIVYMMANLSVLQQIYFLWSKRNLYIKHFDTSDADLSFILGTNNWIYPTVIDKYYT